jgi:hypothetical protein
MSMPGADRRLYPRKNTHGAIRAWMCEMHGSPERCQVFEISRKGVLVGCACNLGLRTIVQFAFAYDRGMNETRLFRRWMRVVRRTATGFALVFVDRPPVPRGMRQRSPR